jgi:hypothetical protein
VFLYEAGGHGFGMKNSTSAAKWTDSLKSWFVKNSILK